MEVLQKSWILVAKPVSTISGGISEFVIYRSQAWMFVCKSFWKAQLLKHILWGYRLQNAARQGAGVDMQRGAIHDYIGAVEQPVRAIQRQISTNNDTLLKECWQNVQIGACLWHYVRIGSLSQQDIRNKVLVLLTSVALLDLIFNLIQCYSWRDNWAINWLSISFQQRPSVSRRLSMGMRSKRWRCKQMFSFKTIQHYLLKYKYQSDRFLLNQTETGRQWLGKSVRRCSLGREPLRSTGCHTWSPGFHQSRNSRFS